MPIREATTENQAATLALEALALLVSSDTSLDRFLALSGIEGANLAERANEPEFLVSVLDFVLSDEPLLTEFCAAAGYDAPAVHKARRTLAGGEAWE